MRNMRLTLAGLMGLVAVAAIGVMGLKQGTPTWAALIFWSVVTLVLGAIVHGAASDGPRRARLLGFALFAGVYLAIYLADEGGTAMPTYPVHRGLEAMHARIHPSEPTVAINITATPIMVTGPVTWTTSPGGTVLSSAIAPAPRAWGGNLTSYSQVGNSLAALLFGLGGAVWAGLLVRDRAAVTSGNGVLVEPGAAEVSNRDDPNGS